MRIRPQNSMPNSATSDNVQVENLKLLQSMQGTLKDKKCNKNIRNNSNSSNDSNRRPFGNGRTDRYCWIDESCNYKSKDYVYKDDGHKDNITLENKMSRSTRACTGSWDVGLEVLNIINHTQYLCHSKTLAHNPTNKLKVVVSKGDSAASGHYWREEDIDFL